MEMLNLEQAIERMNGEPCDSCGMQPPSVKPIRLVAAYRDDALDFEDTECSIVFEGEDGAFYTWEEWGDSSGHGCQCGFNFTKHDTEQQAITLGLTRDAREKISQYSQYKNHRRME